MLFGTLYPLIVDALGLGKISVGPPYFNATFVPLMAPMILAMGIAPFLPWKRADLVAALDRLKLVAGVAIVLAAAVVFLEDRHSFAAALGLGSGSLADRRSRVGGCRAASGFSALRPANRCAAPPQCRAAPGA